MLIQSQNESKLSRNVNLIQHRTQAQQMKNTPKEEKEEYNQSRILK